MGKIQSTDNIDKLLYNYMSQVDESIVNALPDEEEIDYQFSNEFESKMQTMIKRERLKRKYGVPVKTWKRVAAMFIIVLTGLLVPTMSVDAVREKVFSYIRNVYHTYVSTQYFVQDEQAEEFMLLYPTYIPDGYEMVIEDATENGLILTYEIPDGNSIIIAQEKIWDGMEVQTDNEFDNQESCEIQDMEGIIGYREDGVISIYWEKGQSRYTITATKLPKEEVIKVAESLK